MSRPFDPWACRTFRSFPQGMPPPPASQASTRTTTTGNTPPTQLEDISALMRKFNEMSATGSWILIAPDGRVWADTNPRLILGTLAQELPL